MPGGVEEQMPIVQDIRGGMNTDLAPWLLDDSFKDLKNIRIRFGSLEPAFVPTTELSVSLDTSQIMERIYNGSTPNNDKNLWTVQSNGKLHRINILATSPAATSVGTLAGGIVPQTATNTARWLVFGSTAAMQKTDGTNLYQVGIDAPDASIASTNLDVGVLSGTYTYKTVFVGSVAAGASGTGPESPLSPVSNALTITDKTIRLHIDDSADPQVTARRIYRYGGSLTTWKLLTTIGNNTPGVSYLDNTSDASLVVSDDADVTQTAYPAGGELVQSFKNRLFVSGFAAANYQTKVYFSGLGDPDVTNDPTTSDTQGGWFEVGQGDGQKIKALSFVGSVLVIFKEESIYGLFGDHPSFFETRKLANVGVSHTDHVIATPQGIIFRYQDNFWSFDGKQASAITLGKIEKHLQSKAAGIALHGNTVSGIARNEETQEYLFLLNTHSTTPVTQEILLWESQANIFHRHNAGTDVVHAASGMDRAYLLGKGTAGSGQTAPLYSILQETGTRVTTWSIKPRDIYASGATMRLVGLELGGFSTESFNIKITTDQFGVSDDTIIPIPAYTGSFYTRLPDNCYGQKFELEVYSGGSAATMQIASVGARVNIIRRQVAGNV